MKAGKNLKKIREQLRLTQTEFAKKIDIHQTTLCNAENDFRSLSYRACYRVIKLAKKNSIDLVIEDLRPV